MTDQSVRFYAIAPTTFGSDGRVDAGAVAENVSRIAEVGVRGVLLTGSYGEFQVLEADERVAVTQAVTDAGCMASVMSGAAALHAEDAVRVGEALRSAGAHQVMVSAPFAAELTETDVERHFTDIADRLDGDLVIYNNPVFGVDLSPALLETLTGNDAYIGIKQGTRSLAAMVEVIARVQAPGLAQVLAAADLACAAAIGAGVGGVTSTNVWVFPEAFMALADPDVHPSRKAELLVALQPYAALVRRLGQPRTIKAAMAERGFAGTRHVRRPYLELDDEETLQLRAVLIDVDKRLADLTGC